MSQDLSDAVFEALRQNTGLCQQFGDTWQTSLSFAANIAAGNISKFWGDYAAQVDAPWLVEYEPREMYTNMMHVSGQTSYMVDGQIQLAIIATPRSLARQLGELVIDTLNDQPVSWPLAQQMLLRVRSAAFTPATGIGPGVTSIFQRVLTFDYEFSAKRTFILPSTQGVP